MENTLKVIINNETMKKTISIVAVFLMSIIFVGCASEMDYPKLYTSENLPQFENSKVTQIIKDGPTLKDGNLFILESTDDVKTIAAYYDNKMKTLGWTTPVTNEATETSYATQYNGPDKKYIQITVSQIKKGSQTISVNFMQQ